MNFKPSDKVVCLIGATEWSNSPMFRTVGPLPDKDRVYVVRDICVPSIGDVGLILVGSTSFYVPTGNEVGFKARYFRKLEEVQAENKLKREQEEAAALKEATQLINSEP